MDHQRSVTIQLVPDEDSQVPDQLCSSPSGDVQFVHDGNRLKVYWDDMIRALMLAPELHTTAIYPDASLTPVNGPNGDSISLQEGGGGRPHFRLPKFVPSKTRLLYLRLRDPEPMEQEEARLRMAQAVPERPRLNPDKGFKFTSDDVRIACLLSAAANKDDPRAWLLEKSGQWPSKVQSRPLFVRRGDRSRDSPLTPYLLVMTRAVGESHSQLPGSLDAFEKHEERTLWVAFRGTDNVEDVIADLNFLQTGTPLGRVHSGFWGKICKLAKHLGHISREMRETNDKLQPGRPLMRVIFTGHSSGGALAQVSFLHEIANDDLKGQLNEHIGAIAFGSPWVANQEISDALVAKGLSGRLLTVVNDADLVPSLLDYVETAKSVAGTVDRVTSDAATICTTIRRCLGNDRAVLAETFFKAVTYMTEIVDSFGTKTTPLPAYAPLGRLLIIKEADRENNIVSSMLSDTEKIREWVAEKLKNFDQRAEEREVLSRGIRAHHWKLYLDSVRQCATLGDLNAAEAASQSESQTEEKDFAPENIPEDYLLPAIGSCKVEVLANSIGVTVTGKNLHFLNVDAPAFFKWGFTTLEPTAWETLETQSDRILLKIRIDGHQAREDHTQPHFEICLRKYFCDAPRGRSYLARRVDKKNPDEFDDSRIDSAVDDDLRAKLSADFFLAAVRRLFFRLSLDLIVAGVTKANAIDRVNRVLTNSPAVTPFLELCADLPKPRPPEKEWVVVFKDALRDALIAQVKEGEYAPDIKEDRNRVILFSATNRENLTNEITPVLEALVEHLSQPRYYTYKSTLKNGAIVLAVLCIGVFVGVMLTEEIVSAPVAELTTVFAPSSVTVSGAVAGVAGIAKWMSTWSPATDAMEPERRYRSQLELFLNSLGSNIGVLDSCRQLENMLYTRLMKCNFGDVAQANQRAPDWLADDAKLKTKLEWDRESREMFETPATTKRPSLKGCTLQAKLQALRFLRLIMCVRETRKLMDRIFVAFVGESAVGKSSLLKALFQLNITAGFTKQHRTQSISLYPLQGGSQAPISVLDFPGTTDLNDNASATFYDAYGITSMSVIVAPPKGGGLNLRQIARRLRGRKLRPSEEVRRDFAAQGFLLPATSNDDASKIKSPVCVLVSQLDTMNIDPAEAEKGMEAIKAEVAESACVKISQVHLYWNDVDVKQPPDSKPYLVGRGVESVRQFLYEQMEEQLDISEYKEEVRAQLKLEARRPEQ